MTTVKVNHDLCIGCALCASIAPNTFHMNDDGKSDAKNPAADSEETIKEAAEACPIDAITLA